MDMQDTIIIYLLQKYIKGQCTEQELHFLLNWLKSSDDYNCLDSVIKPFWEKIDSQMAMPDEIRVNELQKEVLTLLAGLKKEERISIPPKRNRWMKWTTYSRIAVILVFVLGTTFGIYTLVGHISRPVTYTEYISNRGEKKYIRLEDGTRITLNSATKLRVPSHFNKKSRSIEMVGEGFFEVAQNPDKPFIIRSNDAQVRVLGTSFNLKSYYEDSFMTVTVTTGKVRVCVDKQDLQLSLLANEHLLISKTDGKISKQVIQKNHYVEWMNNVLYFDKEPISEVVKSINRTYNCNVVLESQRSDFLITGTHNRKDVEAILEAICFTTGLGSRKEGKNIFLYDKH